MILRLVVLLVQRHGKDGSSVKMNYDLSSIANLSRVFRSVGEHLIYPEQDVDAMGRELIVKCTSFSAVWVYAPPPPENKLFPAFMRQEKQFSIRCTSWSCPCRLNFIAFFVLLIGGLNSLVQFDQLFFQCQRHINIKTRHR